MIDLHELFFSHEKFPLLDHVDCLIAADRASTLVVHPVTELWHTAVDRWEVSETASPAPGGQTNQTLVTGQGTTAVSLSVDNRHSLLSSSLQSLTSITFAFLYTTAFWHQFYQAYTHVASSSFLVSSVEDTDMGVSDLVVTSPVCAALILSDHIGVSTLQQGSDGSAACKRSTRSNYVFRSVYLVVCSSLALSLLLPLPMYSTVCYHTLHQLPTRNWIHTSCGDSPAGDDTAIEWIVNSLRGDADDIGVFVTQVNAAGDVHDGNIIGPWAAVDEVGMLYGWKYHLGHSIRRVN